MTRSPKESSFSPGFGSVMQARVLSEHASVNGATGISVGPVKVELAGLLKSTWNRKKFRSDASATPTIKLGDPTGGDVFPSRSDGSRLETLGGSWKQMIVAAFPASIFARSSAQAIAPLKCGLKILAV